VNVPSILSIVLGLILLLILPVWAADIAAPARNHAGDAQPAIVEVISPGGIRAWLRQDTSVPLFALEFRFAGGAASVPAAKAGTAAVAASMLSEGAGTRDAENFRQTIADAALRLSFNTSRDSFHGSLISLIETRELASELLRDALTSPHLDARVLKRIKAAHTASARRRAESPDSIAYKVWREVAFAGHPYSIGTEGTEKTLATIEPTDVRNFLDRVLTRDGLIIGAAGHIDTPTLALLLDEVFGRLPDHSAPLAPPPLPAVTGGTLIVPHPAPQSVIVFGHNGPKRQSLDWYAAHAIAQILGGSTFTSRLGAEVREKRGLAYGVGVGLSPGEAGGTLLGRTATRNDAAVETLAIVAEEWARMAAEGPTAAELERAKTYLIGSFPLGLDSTGAVAAVLVQMQVYDLGRDYIQRRPDLYRAITLADAKRVATALLRPERLLSVAVGEPEGVAGDR